MSTESAIAFDDAQLTPLTSMTAVSNFSPIEGPIKRAEARPDGR